MAKAKPESKFFIFARWLASEAQWQKEGEAPDQEAADMVADELMARGACATRVEQRELPAKKD